MRDIPVWTLRLWQGERIFVALAVHDDDAPECVPLGVVAYTEQDVALRGKDKFEIDPDASYPATAASCF